MEFTEIREVDDIAAYSRSFHARKVTVDTDGSFHYARQPAFDTFASGERLEYEKALQDTPPKSASNIFQFEKKQDDVLQEIIGSDEPEENIVNDIQQSLREQSFMLQQTQGGKLKAQKTVSFEVQDIVEQDENEDDETENKNSGKTTDTITNDKKDEKEESAFKTFERMDDHFVSKSYMETRNLKSFLNAKIKALPVGRDGSNYIKRGEMKTFKVYFFTKEIFLQIPVNISATVQEVIQQCLDSYKANNDLDQSLIKFPDRPEIYDLKIAEDTLPLDKSREFKSIRTGRELFLIEPAELDFNLLNNQNSKPKEEIINYQITVHLADEMRTEVPIELNSNSQLKEVYSCLAAQKITAFTSQFYNMRLYHNDAEKKFKEAKNFLDPSMPIKTLKNRIKGTKFELEFVRKQFADEPTEKRKQSDYMIRERSVTVDHDAPLYNEVSANRYEDFEVIKINESGKRQVRIMGIDGFKIYNYTKKYKEEPQGGGMADMLFNTLFSSKFGTMKPERLLTDVIDIKLLNSTTFQLEVKEDGVIKYVDYEVENKKHANQIVAKIKYLKYIEKRNNPQD